MADDLHAAWAQLRSGAPGEARRLALAVLAQDPEHGGAKHLLGVLAARDGDLGSSRLLLGEAAAAGVGPAADSDLGCLELGQRDFDAAAACFERALDAAPDFAEAIANLAQARQGQGRLDEARVLLDRALALQPDHLPLLAAQAELHGRLGDYGGALRFLARAASLAPGDPQIEQAVGRLAELNRHAWHFPMMNDARRNGAFRAAIERNVRPGDLVLEIGTGSGLLAMMAARAGAGRVVSLEFEPHLAALARKVIARNGLSDRIEVLQLSSRAAQVGVHLPRPADVLIAEVLDGDLLGEDLLASVADAQRRLLAPGARVVPAKARLLGRLVESERLARYQSVGEVEGFDLSPFGGLAMPPLMRFDATAGGSRALSRAAELMAFDLAGPLDLRGRRRLDLGVEAEGRLDAVVRWIEIEPAEGIVYSADPEGPWTSWFHAAQPVAGRPRVVPSQSVRLDLEWQRHAVFLEATPLPVDSGPDAGR